MYNVRLAEYKDIPVCVAMCHEFLEEAEYLSFTGFDLKDATGLGVNLVNGDNGLVLVLEKDDQLIGVIGGILAPCLWNTETVMCYELFWWVMPEHRGTKSSIQLLNKFETHAKNKGATHVIMASIPSLNGEKPGKVYKRKGYTERELFYVKET